MICFETYLPMETIGLGIFAIAYVLFVFRAAIKAGFRPEGIMKDDDED